MFDLTWPVAFPLVVFLLVLIIVLAYWQGFNTAINAVLLVLGGLSVFIALEAYHDAQTSGEKQLTTLNASRTALETVVNNMKDQQKLLQASTKNLESMISLSQGQQQLLDKNVKASERMLQVAEERRQIELAQPDVQIRLIYPDQPSVIIQNRSKLKFARQVQWHSIFRNLDRIIADTNFLEGAMSDATKGADYLSPGGPTLPQRIALVPSPDPTPLKPGERLFGFIWVNCSECVAVRIYWTYLIFGKAGWYLQDSLPNEFEIFTDFTLAKAEDALVRFFLHPGLRRIPGR